MTDLDLDSIEARANEYRDRETWLALIAALREARAEVAFGAEWTAQLVRERDEARAEVAAFHYWRDSLAELVRDWMLPQPGEAIEVTIEDAVSDLRDERDGWRRRYEALRDGVTGLCEQADRSHDEYLRGLILDLDAIAARAEAVTRLAPWTMDSDAFAHARTDVPALVAALREARAEVERLRGGSDG